MASPDEWSHNGTRYSSKTETTWNDIFAAVSPLMIDEVTDEGFKKRLNNLSSRLAHNSLQKMEAFEGLNLMSYLINDNDFQTIKVQLRALGLITKSTKNRSVKDKNTYWSLTLYGDTAMTRLRAIHRQINTEKEPFVDQPELETESKTENE